MVLGTLVSGGVTGIAAFAQTTPNFGPNVTIIASGTSPADVTTALNKANVETQFGTGRHAVLFMPGTYGTAANSVYADIGYYESVAGLGQSPNQVTITGGLVADQIIDGGLTENFWRSQENLTEVPVGGESSGLLDWGVSQGASLRRVNVKGGLFLANSGGAQPCLNASGGFTADSVVTGTNSSCSQQQWYTRDSTLGSWTGGVWNMVFSGVQGAPAQSFPTALANPQPTAPETVLPATPVSREKPFLYVDGSGNYNVFVPTVKTNSSGTTWANGGNSPGYSMPIGNFFIAQPTNTAEQINAALASPGFPGGGLGRYRGCAHWG